MSPAETDDAEANARYRVEEIHARLHS